MTNPTMGLNRLPELGPALSDNGEKAVGAAALATSSGAVLACSACCVLPLAIPALALALSATTIAWIEAAKRLDYRLFGDFARGGMGPGFVAIRTQREAGGQQHDLYALRSHPAQRDRRVLALY